MKRFFIILTALMCGVASFAQVKHSMLALNWGVGVPFEVRDLKAVGPSLQVSCDVTYPLHDTFSLGFYVNAGGGMLCSTKPYNKYDRFYSMFRVSGGILMECGDLSGKPWVFGLAPFTGICYVDMDLVLPLEMRFGKKITDRWYIMGELVYGMSLANETFYWEPVIRVGYNFGDRKKK
ncbi:MAG: hypothetical protein IJP50_00445 [Paludibacteraceae bacterium]|nr:hypothetical protein [Paludibacteraceae bacterium]